MTLRGSCISPVSKRICLRAFFTAMERHLSCTNYRYDEFSGEFAVRLAHKPSSTGHEGLRNNIQPYTSFNVYTAPRTLPTVRRIKETPTPVLESRNEDWDR